MWAQRIRRGFHRIGLALALLFGLPGFVGMIAAIPLYLTRNPFDQFDPLTNQLWMQWLLGGSIGVGLAAVSYGLAWTTGWIVAAFVGDGEISN